MKNCKKCSTELREDAKFCGKCGDKIEEEVHSDICKGCGTKNEEDSKFCAKCGTPTSEQKSNPIYVQGYPVSQTPSAPQNIIKCGNCDYIGPGEPARSTGAKILAWICVVFAPLITIIYFLATSKYRCPKCKSTFLGIKNKEGVFVGQKGSKASTAILIFLCILVGIAIIGILASVVLASLNTARAKGADANIKANLANARAQAEIYYDSNNNSYLDVCTTTQSGIKSLVLAAAKSSLGTTPLSIETDTISPGVCNDTKTAWAASVPLKAESDKYYCVDSTGAAIAVSTKLSTQTSCSGNNVETTSTSADIPELSGSQICARDIPNSTWDGKSYMDNGNYQCTCKTGYEINKAGNACQTPNQNCNEQYPNSVDIGNNTCDCKTGYSWNSGQTACYR